MAQIATWSGLYLKTPETGLFISTLILAAVSLTLSLIVCGALYLSLLPLLSTELKPYLESASEQPVLISGNRFRPVVYGTGGYEGSSSIITGLKEGRAVMSARVSLSSGKYPFLRWTAEGLNPGYDVYLFWRTSKQPNELFSAQLQYSSRGDNWVNLSKHSKTWTGHITEIGLLLNGDLRGNAFTLKQVALEPYGNRALLHTVWHEWTSFQVWQGYTINAYRGQTKHPLVFPALAFTLIGALALALNWQFHTSLRNKRDNTAPARARRVYASALTILATCWVSLDGLWQYSLSRQSNETHHLFAGKSYHEKQLADFDGAYYAFAHEITENHLPENLPTIPLLAIGDTPEAFGLRLRYHLLPQHRLDVSKFVRPRKGSNNLKAVNEQALKHAETFPYFIVVSSPAISADKIDVFGMSGLQPTGREELIFANEAAALFKVNTRIE